MTTNEITQITDAEILPATQRDNLDRLQRNGLEKLREHAEMQTMAMQYADFIVRTGGCPEIYRGKPNDAAAAILRGVQLGFDPAGALEAFFVIKGKVGMYARAMIAVAENIGCTVWEDSASDVSVTWSGTRPGGDKVESVTWTIERAKAAGYTSNSKYATNPQEMLRSKCQTELARIIAPGALMGMVSEVEKVSVRATIERVADPQRGMAGLGAALGITAPADPVEDVGVVMATPDQQKRIAALLDVEKLDTRQGKLDYLEGQFGRKFTSVAKLTGDEAGKLIEFLTAAQASDAEAEA